MSRTVTKPPDDPKMWRRVLKLAHPDAGGDTELFVWARELQERICSGALEAPRPQPPRRERPSTDEPGRVPFDHSANFAALTRRAYVMADEVDAPYARLLGLLVDCQSSLMHETQERRGASYRMLAAIGHKCEMTKRERANWYRIAESIPLSDRHAGHILSRLKQEAA